MKRIIGILAVALIIAGFLAGCTPQEENHDPQPAAVMVEGKLYYDSGQKIGVLRCGVMDGYITSTVEYWQLPEKDGRSNFGTGYSWQLVDRHHIDIPMDDAEGWARFCDGRCETDHSTNLGTEDVICGYPKAEDFNYSLGTESDVTVVDSQPFTTE